MFSVDYPHVLLLAPVAALVAWFVATRGRRARLLTGLAAALSAALIVAALAGIFLHQGAALRVFLVDVSASTRRAGASALKNVGALTAGMEAHDRVAVIAFGRNASILLPPTPCAEVPPSLPQPVGVHRDATCVEAALETACAMFPEGASGDVVLVTDGRENMGDAMAPAARLAAAGRAIHSLTFSPGPKEDTWVEAVRVSASVSAGQDIDFEVLVGATSPMHGKLVLLLNGRELAGPEPIDLAAGRTVLRRRAAARTPGLYTLTARLLCPGDTTSENNEASASVRVTGKLNVACVSSGRGDAVAEVLARSEAVALRRTRPQGLALTNEEMLRNDVVVLGDVSAEELGRERIAWLSRFVHDAGGGLMVFGGSSSFGPGGYAETPLAALLPVDPDPERRAAKPSSVVIVADRSGSMAETVGGREKIEFVRQALLRAGTEFGARTGERSDELSVVAFSQEPEELLVGARVGTPGGAAALRSAAGRLFPSGRTNIRPALTAALSILAKSELKRHVILVSDGRSQDHLDGPAISKQMKTAETVLSVLAIGAEMNEGLSALKTAADATAGRFVMLDTISELPAAMARETRTISGSLVRRGRFTVRPGPGATAKNLTELVKIRGYVLTGARKGAPPLLVADGAPVLARWRRGLGRVVACTTSLDDWASEWAAKSPDLFARLVLWAGAGERQQQVTVRLLPDAGRMRITADAAAPLDDGTLRASFLRPGGNVSKIEMRQVGRLRYVCTTDAAETGTYVARVSSADTASVLGEGHVTIGYSAEWNPPGDASVARRLSQLTSGTVLRNLRHLPPLPSSTTGSDARRNLAYVLLSIAAVVFLISSLR